MPAASGEDAPVSGRRDRDTEPGTRPRLEDDAPARSTRGGWPAIAAGGLLLAHAALLAWSAYCHSPVIDEVGHLPAGLSHWHFGNFALYRVNPPLVRGLAALPVFLSDHQVDWTNFREAPLPRLEWRVGVNFIHVNGPRAFRFFLLARWACLPLCLIGGYVCYRWARALYGPWAGVLALSVFSVSPNVIAWGSTIMPDAASAALGVTAGYAFWRWLETPRWRRALAAGACLGFAELTKTTWLILFPLWPALWLSCGAAAARAGRLAQGAQLAAMLIIAVALINVAYLGEGSFAPLRSYRFVSETLSGVGRAGEDPDPEVVGNRFAGSWLGTFPVPLPRDYVMGIDLQKLDFELKPGSFLRGEHRRGGWWYYYLYALAIKEPLGTLGLIALALAVSLGDPKRSTCGRRELVLLAPAVAVFVLVSAQTGINRNFRYVLPALPFVYIWAGKLASPACRQRNRAIPALAAALAWGSAISSLSCYPHSLSYFNELVGGPRRGHDHLIDSNIDWGQDLFALKQWVDAHPEASPLRVALYTPVDPRSLGIESVSASPNTPETARRRGEESGPWPGWYAISVHRLHDEDGDFDVFRRLLEPKFRIGYSIYVYEIDEPRANAIRDSLGLPRIRSHAEGGAPSRTGSPRSR